MVSLLGAATRNTISLVQYIDHNGTELLNETGPRLRDSQAIDIILVHLCSHYVEQRPTVY